MKAVIFCGYHHTGKTTLLERAIGPLARRGHRVGVVKHATGRLDFGASGKDLSRYMSAGAVEVHLLSLSPGLPRPFSDPSTKPGELPLPEGSPSERLEPRLEGVLTATSADFLLIEGFKDYRGPFPRIVFGKNREEIESLIDGNTVGYSGFGLGRQGFVEAPSEERRIEGRLSSARFLSMDIEPEAIADFLEGISRR
jgi:molybdopterin-guanine dinucleotide biosynthesis protein